MKNILSVIGLVLLTCNIGNAQWYWADENWTGPYGGEFLASSFDEAIAGTTSNNNPYPWIDWNPCWHDRSPGQESDVTLYIYGERCGDNSVLWGAGVGNCIYGAGGKGINLPDLRGCGADVKEQITWFCELGQELGQATGLIPASTNVVYVTNVVWITNYVEASLAIEPQAKRGKGHKK